MLVKVVNDNVHPYRERFRDQDIYIEPKGSIKMDLNDAHLFLGTMPSNIEVDANGIQKATSYKMLRIETLATEAAQPEAKKFVCMKDGKEFPSQAALDKHIEENWAEEIIDEEAREKVVAKRGRKPKEA